MDTASKHNLLQRCQNKEEQAFKELYDQYARALFNVSMRMVNNRDEAEDILQESFVKAFKDMKRFESLPAFGSWIKKVVINGSLDVLRKKKFEPVTLDEEVDVTDDETEEEQADYDMQIILKCVSALPAGYRVILTLFLFEGYSHKQIAEELNISEGTSKSQYNRARKKLAELIRKKHLTHA